MPITKSAIKKLRQDKVRQVRNKALKMNLKEALKKALETKSSDAILNGLSLIDKAVKNNLIHKNKAARLKSRLSKIPPNKTVSKKVKK